MEGESAGIPSLKGLNAGTIELLQSSEAGPIWYPESYSRLFKFYSFGVWIELIKKVLSAKKLGSTPNSPFTIQNSKFGAQRHFKVEISRYAQHTWII
jgi:hypothetical protein